VKQEKTPETWEDFRITWCSRGGSGGQRLGGGDQRNEEGMVCERNTRRESVSKGKAVKSMLRIINRGFISDEGCWEKLWNWGPESFCTAVIENGELHKRRTAGRVGRSIDKKILVKNGSSEASDACGACTGGRGIGERAR